MQLNALIDIGILEAPEEPRLVTSLKLLSYLSEIPTSTKQIKNTYKQYQNVIQYQ